MAADPAYVVRGINLGNVRNRNESRVIKSMQQQLAEMPGFCGCQICLEDVFAVALNRLSPQYVQRTSILLRNKGASDREIEAAVAAALERVGEAPNHEPMTG